MTLTDTGPLVGLLDKKDPYHQICIDAAAILPREPMLTTWPCFTEAMYLLGTSAGPGGQSALWNLLLNGVLQLHDSGPEQRPRMAELMKRYQDLPMDLADASIVTAAESTGRRRVFSLDEHLRIVQLNDGSFLEVVP